MCDGGIWYAGFRHQILAEFRRRILKMKNSFQEPTVVRIHRDIVSCKVVDVNAILSEQSKKQSTGEYDISIDNESYPVIRNGVND
jgi:hypothetical protein